MSDNPILDAAEALKRYRRAEKITAEAWQAYEREAARQRAAWADYEAARERTP